MKVASIALLALAATVLSRAATAQHVHAADSSRIAATDAAMSGALSANAKKHMELTAARRPTRDDSVKARAVATTLRSALRRYADTSAAVADGYRMFLPNLKQQKVFHFTNYRLAAAEAFRFDPAKPTSILYQRDSAGRLVLIGAMYTAPKRMRAARLDARIPLSIARWHKHVNWCVPPKGSEQRWLERRYGEPVFGPESRIATKQECDAVGGEFHPSLFGWMLHANVFLGDDLATVYGHDH